MRKDRTQLNINIDPQLLLFLKSEAIKNGKTLTDFVTSQLRSISTIPSQDSLEQRLLKIEEHLGISENPPHPKHQIGTIFTDQGAKEYGETARVIFESNYRKKGISCESALRELSIFLIKYQHSDPELVFRILLGTHILTSLEMSNAYRRGSCAMRTALSDWADDPLEQLNDTFLNAVITKSFK